MSARAELLQTIAAEYTPGSAVTAQADRKVKAAAAVLEAEAGPPDLMASPSLVAGCWQLLFDTRDLLFESRDMDRMSGGMLPAQTVKIHNCFQELRAPEGDKPGFYRNSMTMQAQGVDFIYISTASFTVSPDQRNMFQVRFHTTSFVPFSARTSTADLRAALQMPAEMPMDMTTPPIGPFPSLVTYCDGGLRINRGSDYIAVLQKLA